jgi:ABC-2 type transport system ATP-binding protein
MFCVSTENLSYRFTPNEIALQQLNLRVPQGAIYGFLGANGAGKTTTLRLLLGLLRRQQGEIEIFGQDFYRHRIEILRRIGSLIETPSIYGQLSAEENLLVWQKIYQCPRGRINEVLKLVDLAHTGKKRAGSFSLGMKQRLSIAIALLHQPSLLILDEPTNGLDPNGIIEMRELLRKLNVKNGISIVISSHLLPEIEKLVTDVGIIHKGRMLFQGSLEELISRQRQFSSVVIEVNQPEQCRQILLSQHIEARIEKNRVMIPVLPRQSIARINAQLVQEGIDVYEISTEKNDLESVFIELVK